MTSSTNKLLRIGKFVGIAGFGSIVGIKFEHWRINQRENVSRVANEFEVIRKPGLPLFATVSAATPMTETRLAPIESAPAIEIPPKDPIKGGVPAEPPPGLNRIAEIMRFGFPGLDNIRAHRDYVLSYDRRNKTAHWVFEHLTKVSVARNDAVDRANSQFMEDESIHKFFRSNNADYKYSGFDRGHLAAAGNHRLSQEICNETFLLSNMAPQVGAGFNRDKWEHLERYVRKLTKLYKNVYVCTGPLYLPRQEPDGKSYIKYQVIGANNVAVPTHFFKVVVCELDNQQGLEMEAYVLPNEPIPDSVPLVSFQVPPDSIERAAGLLFFDKLSRNQLKKINGKKTGWF